MFRKFSIIALSFLATFNVAQCQIDPITQQSIDNLFETFLPSNNIPALGLAITRDGQTLYTQGYGNRDVENSIPANNDTLFFIGSISKSFTATIVVKTLSEKFPLLGELVLDTPIAELIPTYNITFSDRYRSESTTFRDLLAHRGCQIPEGLGTTLGAFQSGDELIYRQRYAEELCPFRTNFVYNNGHFSLAGDVISEISGISYLDMMGEFFSTLGMTETVFVKSSDDHDNMANRARGYYYKDGQLSLYNSGLYRRFIPLTPAGGILSSPKDMVKYMQFHLNLGKVGNVQVVPEETMKWFKKNSNPFRVLENWKTNVSDVLDTTVGYSLALNVGTYDGYHKLFHNGYLPPFSSQLSLYPALNLGIFTTTNGPGPLGLTDANASHASLHNMLFEILRGANLKTVMSPGKQRPLNSFDPYPFTKPFSSMKKLPSTKHSAEVKVVMQPLQAENIVGHYGSPLSGEMDIIEKINSTGQMELYMNYGEWGNAWVRPTSNEVYSLDWESDFLQDFYASTSPDGIPVITVAVDSTKLTMFSSDTEGPVEVFFKDQRLENLPETPWTPGSCGPQEP